jgi:hypothetical protein
LNSRAVRGEVVAITIGPTKAIFNVHKDLICHHSEYFRIAYNGRWKEAEDGVVLEDIEVEVFELFVHWLYAQSFPKVREVKYWQKSDMIKANKATLLLLLQACVFADRFMASGFLKAAHNEFINENDRRMPWYEHVIFAYSNFHEESQILKFMVDAQACFWSAEADDNAEMLKRSELPAEFLPEVTARRFELKRGVVPMDDDEFDISAYHIHDSNKERWECPKYGSMKGRRKGNKLDRSYFV